MKSNSTSSLFQDKFHGYTKRDRCPNLNIGSALPFAVTSLFIASVFTFFLLYSPNSLTLIPNQPSHSPIQHQQHNPSSKPQKEQKRCDLFKGKWVRSPRSSSYYTNSSCTTIPDSKNCFKQGRKDSDFLNWKWKPDECELESFNPKTFLHLVRGKRFAFIGDSVARNHMDSLLCLLSQEEIPVDKSNDTEDRFRTWHFPTSNFTLMTLWSRYLIVAEERIINGTASSIFDLHLDRPDPDWTSVLPTLDFALLSAGHWFFRIMYLHHSQTLLGCVYCDDHPNLTQFKLQFAFRMALRAAYDCINAHAPSRALIMFRTLAPSHFEGGVWNTGGYCNRTGPMGVEEVDWRRFEWEMREVQMEEFERGRKEGEERGRRYEAVDVTRAMMMRPDAHPGEYWGNKYMRGYNDCTHWCLPGPVDFWSDLLLAILKAQV
ncbi:protein ALTERED XYLOGLUCAN 4-like [Senna tora]|uniref:Protein ALTERED XYLOGLUCAN 4-like n=1 Tax=Senna tora TaxID=362788 RepID=A0A834WDS4_9FABA|nr:protein ALTERED XYLOGLUCAN 4-like [Senna tora]